MTSVDINFGRSRALKPAPLDSDRWEQSCQQLLAAVSDELRPTVEALLHRLHGGGSGLREWVSAIAWRGAVCPTQVPVGLIEIYLTDPEAAPLYDCESCGLAIPVRPSRFDIEQEPEIVYFVHCPACGGRTGPYFYWSRQLEGDPVLTAIQRRVPR